MLNPCSENWARAQGPKPWRKPPNAVAMRRSRCDKIGFEFPLPTGSVGDFYRIGLAPFAQRLFRGFRFEIVPPIKGASSYQQRSKFWVGASLAEYVSDLIEVVWQKFACKVQRQRLAETELSFVGDRDVFLVILDVIGHLVVQFVQFVQVGKFGVPVDLARPPVEDGLMLANAAESNEFEGVEDFLKADGHWSAAKRGRRRAAPP